MRAVLSVGLCLTVLALGLHTAWLAARNRERGAELDARQRWCETFARQNQLLRRDVEQQEWQLLSQGAAERNGATVPVGVSE